MTLKLQDHLYVRTATRISEMSAADLKSLSSRYIQMNEDAPEDCRAFLGKRDTNFSGE